MPLAPRLSLQSAVQLVLAGHLGLLFVVAAVHRGEVMGRHWGYDFWLPYQAILGGMFIAQVGLVALWAGLSRASITLRFAAIVCFVPLLALVQSAVFADTWDCGWWRANRDETTARHITWVAALLSFAVPLFAGCVLMRVIGLRLASPTDEADQGPRFTVREAVYLMSCIAVCCAVGKWLMDEGLSLRKVWVVSGWTFERTIAPLEFAALGCVLAGLIFSPWNWRWIVTGLFILPTILGILDPLCFRPWFADLINQAVPWQYYELTYTSFAFTLAATLFVFRDRGYRLIATKRKPDA